MVFIYFIKSKRDRDDGNGTFEFSHRNNDMNRQSGTTKPTAIVLIDIKYIRITTKS